MISMNSMLFQIVAFTGSLLGELSSSRNGVTRVHLGDRLSLAELVELVWANAGAMLQRGSGRLRASAAG